MPQQRKWRDNAEKQKAYRERKKAQRALDAVGVPLDAPVGKSDTAEFTERIQRAGEDAIDQFFRR